VIFKASVLILMNVGKVDLMRNFEIEKNDRMKTSRETSRYN